MRGVEMDRIILRTRLRGQRKGFLQSQEFKDNFLSSPCECCGSGEHSLLKEVEGPKTRSQRVRYQYSCPIAEFEDLYIVDSRHPDEEIHISFNLAADRYAQAWNYDERLAINSLPVRYRTDMRSNPPYMDSFVIEVRRQCMLNYGLDVNPSS